MSSKTLELRGMNEGNNFENSRGFSKIGLLVILAKQGCRNVSNIGGAPIYLDQSFIESMQLLVPKIIDMGDFPPISKTLRKNMWRGAC